MKAPVMFRRIIAGWATEEKPGCLIWINAVKRAARTVTLQEEMMTRTEHFKAKLEQRLAELQHRTDAIEGELTAPGSADWQERAVEHEGDEVLIGMEQSAATEMGLIRQALERITSGRYGLCLRCGEAIADQRLELLPMAPLCQVCATRQ